MNLIKNLTLFGLFSLTLTLSACSIPDLPGPIGIPGIEIQPFSEGLKQTALPDA